MSDETLEILRRLTDRQTLTAEVLKSQNIRLGEGAGVVLQARTANAESSESTSQQREAKPKDVLEAVNYRLAITDLFVEKAQFHLEHRADRYERLGIGMYALAIVIFILGTFIAMNRMLENDKPTSAATPRPPAVVSVAPSVAPNATQTPGSTSTSQSLAAVAATDATTLWVGLLTRFVLSFTAFGFVVLTAVALARGARGCLDQRERLLSKRHSLRQGRLYLHLAGGHVTIEEMERAFTWNHAQLNAFTHMTTDAKAPWGTVLEEIVKMIPELVKAGATATQEAADKKGRG